MSPADREGQDGAAWLRMRERGSDLGIAIVIFVATRLGRRAAWALLWPVAVFYAITAVEVRRASRAYLDRALRFRGTPRRVRWFDVIRHLHVFAMVTLDRVWFVRGDTCRFEVTREGSELLREQIASGRGALLVGAHVGSFEALRSVSSAHDVVVHVLAHLENARRINRWLTSLGDAGLRGRVITIDPDRPAWILEVKALIEAGALVALLADRVGLTDRAVEVSLLGAPYRLPVGPYKLAATLRCPIFFVVGAYDEASPARRGRYTLSLAPLTRGDELWSHADEAARARAVAEVAARYAAAVERWICRAPYTWFNFFEAWVVGSAADGGVASEAADTPPHPTTRGGRPVP
jgi:predicted LPLAT superfamily acyltransferase